MSVRYKVWPFRKFHGCYECDNIERIEAVPLQEGFELSGEEFIALERSVKQRGTGEFVYLYHVIGQDDDRLGTSLRAHVDNGLEIISDEKERERRKLEKIEEKKQRDALTAAADALNAAKREREEYEKLKRKFEK